MTADSCTRRKRHSRLSCLSAHLGLCAALTSACLATSELTVVSRFALSKLHRHCHDQDRLDASSLKQHN
eukprot:6199608-Pleurochrysis_carterae.AAC.2